MFVKNISVENAIALLLETLVLLVKEIRDRQQDEANNEYCQGLKKWHWFGSNKFFVLRAKEGVLSEWAYYCLQSSNFLEEGKSAMAGTDGRRALRKDFIENFLIPLPPLEIQEKLVKELEEEREIINWQKQSISLLEKKKEKYLKSLW